tara:strand:+ start:3191 stop:4027 length:837 start_codon:yes stop_codon:yes gene_type:complete
MDTKPITTRKIIKINKSKVNQVSDFLAIEDPLEISISIPSALPAILNKNISITMRTPNNDANLAIGFLFTEGIISTATAVEKIKQSENKITIFLENDNNIDLSTLDRNFYTSSSCGVCGKASIDSIKTVCKIDAKKVEFKIDSSLIKGLPDKLRKEQEVFESTGGLHAAALFSLEGSLLILKEDVGRHNALDKLIGHSLMQNAMPLSNHLLLLSGRASFELIQKAAMAGIQFIMAVGAPSSLAVELAVEFDITLIGFLTKDKFNIYCGEKRIENLNFE